MGKIQSRIAAAYPETSEKTKLSAILHIPEIPLDSLQLGENIGWGATGTQWEERVMVEQWGSFKCKRERHERDGKRVRDENEQVVSGAMKETDACQHV